MENQPGRFVMVVGVDFTAEAERALGVACSIATTMPGAEIHAVHAVPTPINPFVMDIVAHVDLGSDRERLDALCDRYRRFYGVFVVPHLVLDEPEHGIVDVARDRNADLIVIGTHGRTGIERLLLGSLAERIQRRAPCSVLVMRMRPGLDSYAPPLEPAEPAIAFEQRL
jgi:nucleotide-binding universal stress UspA family protein